MFYSAQVSIPAQTLAMTPYSTQLVLSEGVIRRVWVRWRFGSGNLCGVRILQATFQYWPLSIGEWFPSTVHPLEFEEYHALVNSPYTLDIEGYNTDDVHSHEVWIGVLVSRVKAVPGLIDLINYMAGE